MPRPWVNNESGPLCSCGAWTAVKVADHHRPGALCIGHTQEAGTWIELPAECPDDWVPWTEAEMSETEGSIGPQQATIEAEVGAFIPKVYAAHFARVLYEIREKIPSYHAATLAGLWRSLRTAEAEPQTNDA